ncbi:MAG: Membrane-bound lytic murein transglycosylase D precursor (EC [uncultured Campylobacterales bacterium]|uniref:Membrane-bound lytic murein transglycosylase D (EC) n=1 Tax=uncultured Campylobacterales bacterium TaxID=352960 RepID=A0A6S6SY05_9BACT|nr:MAG: Membrane-bound lytic murein transglycosylase D precursor (EC [uncultured Campylobacterales bacterium]
MKKLLLSFLLVFNIAFSSLLYFDDLETYILKSLDINELFLQDLKYIDMKKNKSKYHLDIKPKNEKFVTIVKNIIEDDPTIPLTILYLAMAESKFELKARSWIKAGGIWQFMPKTAKNFGLKMNMYVDERYDIENSTKAAITYLKYLNKRFDKWYLTLMAYNCGEGRLSKIIRKIGSDDLMQLLASRQLPFETKMHIRKIVAMAYFNHKNYLNIPEITKVDTKGGLSLYVIAKKIGISTKELKSINPHLKHNFLPPYNNYHIYLPSNKVIAFRNNFTHNKDVKYHMYTVKNGDSLGLIAEKFNIKYQIIKDFNDIKNDIIYIGQKLTIPIVASTYAKIKSKKNDTLALISKGYNIKSDTLTKIRIIKNKFILSGDQIVIPNS